MEFQTINQNKWKKITIILGVFIVIAVTITYMATRAKYQNTEIIPLVNGVVNYKAYDFKVMAMYKQKEGQTCTDKNNTCYEEITSMPESGYTINETNSYCTTDGTNHSNARLFTNELNQHVFEKITKSDKCYIWFDKIVTDKSIDQIVADATTTKTDFSTVATTDEGTFIADDPMYGENAKTTYFRGAVTNNWVKFGGHFWRIIRKNGDGTLRLIYSGTAEGTDASAIPNVTIEGNGARAAGTGTQIGESAYVTSNYSTNTYPAYVGWTYKTNSARPTSAINSGAGASADPITSASTPPTSTTTEYRSTAYERILTWFNTNISEEDQTKVDAGKFCNDRTTQDEGTPNTSNTSSSYYFAAYKRLVTNKTPVLFCSNAGDIYATKVGLITADEVALAGGVWNTSNKLFYLYNGQIYWTISPYWWYYYDTNGHYSEMFVVQVVRSIYANSMYSSSKGLRPVINLKANTQFKEDGTGTYNNPYVVI